MNATQLAAQVAAELNATRMRLNEIVRAGGGAGNPVLRAFGTIHGAQMAALRLLEHEAAAAAQRQQQQFVTIAARGPKGAITKLIRQSQEG
jgi:hypothetical protein